jgi:hypothetical protein
VTPSEHDTAAQDFTAYWLRHRTGGSRRNFDTLFTRWSESKAFDANDLQAIRRRLTVLEPRHRESSQ